MSSECETGPADDEKAATRARNAAYRLLTLRPRSRRELEEKLRAKEFSDPVVEEVVKHCARLGYIDDRKFALQWAAYRARCRGYGRRRIEQELKRKGIGRELISEALTESVSSEQELEAAQQAAERKLRSLRTDDPEARRRRLAGFLERKGFSFEIIHAVLRSGFCTEKASTGRETV
jgi:regulatory protein